MGGPKRLVALSLACITILCTGGAEGMSQESSGRQLPPSETASLQPFDAWTLIAEPAYCALQRSFGDAANPYVLSIQFDPLKSLSWLRIRHREDLKARFGGDANVEVNDRPLPQPLHFNIFRSESGDVTREFMFNKFRKEVPLTTKRLRLATPAHGDLLLDMSGFDKAMQAADACMVDLYGELGIDIAQAARVAAPPEGLVLKGINYPMKNDQFDVTLLYWVNEQGRVDECKVLSPPRHDRFEATLCDKIKDKARLKPATDANGVAIRAPVFDDIRIRRMTF